MNAKTISLPADLTGRPTSRARLTALGVVSFLPEGVKFRTAFQLFFKINLVNKHVWKYHVGKPIPYADIVDVLPFTNNCLELVTDQVNGSYFLSVPYSQSDSISDISAFLQRCRDEGFDRAIQDQALLKNVESHCTRAKKAMIAPTMILMLASFALAGYVNIFIGLLLSLFAHVFAKQSGSRIIYVISIVLIILMFALALWAGI